MRKLFLSVAALALIAAATAAPPPAAARGWIGIGSGAPGWTFYAPSPYFAYPIDLSYHRSTAYPDGFFIGGSFGGHSLHHWW